LRAESREDTASARVRSVSGDSIHGGRSQITESPANPGRFTSTRPAGRR
jgi:hypothetical protein